MDVGAVVCKAYNTRRLVVYGERLLDLTPDSQHLDLGEAFAAFGPFLCRRSGKVKCLVLVQGDSWGQSWN